MLVCREKFPLRFLNMGYRIVYYIVELWCWIGVSCIQCSHDQWMPEMKTIKAAASAEELNPWPHLATLFALRAEERTTYSWSVSCACHSQALFLHIKTSSSNITITCSIFKLKVICSYNTLNHICLFTINNVSLIVVVVNVLYYFTLFLKEIIALVQLRVFYLEELRTLPITGLHITL